VFNFSTKLTAIMATVSFFLDRRNSSSDRFPLVLRISHLGKRKDLPTGYKLATAEWNAKKHLVRRPYENATKANVRLKRKIALATEVLAQYATTINSLNVREIAILIEERFKKEVIQNLPFGVSLKKTLLKEYAEKVATRYDMAKRYGTADNFRDVTRFLIKYKNDQLLLTDIDETFLEELEAWYLGQGLKLNGLSARLRPLRRIYNLAIKDKETELTIENYPFGRNGYSIKSQKTRKRAVKLDVIDAIRNLRLEKFSGLWHHRNYFLFMFNMRGMNFIDLAFLEKTCIQEGRIRYKRRKTKRGQSVKEFDIKILDEAQEIISYYIDRKSKSPYVFPILDDCYNLKDEKRLYKMYMSKLSNHNRRLLTIGKMIGLPEKLSSYVVRHTFATAGLRKGISKAQIGDMLGHTSYYTTEVYFDDFDKEVLDEAAEKILK
jgi:site-specific recombinase XerD